MAENNDFNLVISDEENTNLVSNRTLQNTLSPPNNNQFVRRTSDKNRGDTAQQNHMYSPQFTETFGSGSKVDAMSFPAENYFSPKQNWDEGNVYSSYEGFSTESNKKGGFVKKSKRQQHSEEVYVADDDHYPETSQRREYASAQGYINEEDQQNNYGQEHERMIKTTSDRFEGDYGDFQGEEGSQGYEDDERRVQSLRDSQLSGPVRYSKMSEEEAARAFENRKKELFSTYLKKPPTKKANSKPSSPGGDLMRGNNRNDIPQDDSGKPGFVIFNNKDNKVPNQPPGSKSQGGENQNGLLNVKRVPSSGKKNDNGPSAKQRKDSPSSRKAPQVNQRQTPKNQKAPMTQTFGKHKEAQRIQKPSFNDNQRREQQKNRNEQYREYYARNIEEITETNESNYERQNQGQPAEQPEYNNVYFMNKMKNKNSEILNDIQSIDDEISQLENETGIRSSTPQIRNNQENNRVDERAYNSQPVARGRPQEEPMQGQAQKGGYGDKNAWKSTKRPNSQQRENSAEKVVQGNAVGNINRINQSPSQQREKRQMINDLQNGDERGTESHRDPIKEHIYQSYAVLNEKGFEHHYDYLYERALIQKKNKDLLQETNRNVKEHQEIVQCTFQPRTNTYTNPRRQDIVTQTKNWQLEKEKQLQANEKYKIEKELRECTFYPNGMLEKEERLLFNSNDFYKRNVEWLKRKEADDMRKQNELYKSMMSAPEKPKSHASMSFSRIHESQIIEDKVSPSGRTTEAGRMFRDPSNKSFRSTKDKAERSNSATKRDNSQKKKEPLKNINNRPSSRNERHMSPKKTEKPLKTQESATKNNKKNLSSLNLQSQIMESYAILDNLQYMLSAKEKEKHQKVVHQKENVDKKLKTIIAPQSTQESTKQPAPRGTQGKGAPSMRPTASPHRSPRTSAKLSVRNQPYETKPPEEFVQSIVVRKNRYFIEERPAEKPQQKASKERSRSIDNRKTKRVATPTKEYKLSDMRGGSYVAAANQAKQRKESPFKTKQITRNYETSASKSVYSDIKGSPWRSVLHSPQSEVFLTGPSPRYDINNVTKGITSPNSQALEKKYLDLLNQVSRVTKQLDHFNVENASLQEDISVMQKRQMNSNLLYS